ncbi:MAG: hypothetical protein ACRBN8_18365 [Nannocystales bacterium]
MESAPCPDTPRDCGPVREGIMCDDCGADEVSTRAPGPVVVRCLEHALRCGPDAEEKQKWATQGPGAVPAWTDHFYIRAASLLGTLKPAGTEALLRSRAWALPARASEARDRALGIPDQYARERVPTPAGRSACGALPQAQNVTDAALHCFQSRVKPAVLDLERRVRDHHDAASDYPEGFYRFGSGPYVRETYALPPVVEVDQRPWPQVARALEQLPPDLLKSTTALGALETVSPERDWIVVNVRLRSPEMPVDAATHLQFVIDEETWTTVFVFRVVNG